LNGDVLSSKIVFTSEYYHDSITQAKHVQVEQSVGSLRRKTQKASMTKKTYVITAVADALHALEWIAQNNGQLTLSEIAEQAGINKSKAFRILHTFEALEYVQKIGEDGRYALGERLVDLGLIALGRPNLPSIARPQMRKLLEKFGETVFLAILDGVDILHLEILESTQRIRISPSTDTYNGAHRTSLGKAILAHLPKDELAERLRLIKFVPLTANTILNVSDLRKELKAIRERCYAIDNEESELGARCVGAPIFDADGYPVAALSIEAPSDRLKNGLLQEIGEQVITAADACSRTLGYLVKT
jgi:DNA-binding IclR family transcriptional regulator